MYFFDDMLVITVNEKVKIFLSNNKGQEFI